MKARVDHRRFGAIEVPEGDVLRFGGIPGFPDADRFALLRGDRPSAFLWLVSLDDPELAFAVTDPRTIFPGYCPKVDAQARARVEAEEHDELEILAVATVRDGEATLNLAAPVVVNPRSRRGAQVVLEDEAVSARTPLPAAPREETPAARPDAQIESKPQT